MRRPIPRWGLLAVAALALLAHGRALVAGFVYDDASAILTNPVVQGALDLERLLGRDFWGQPPGQGVGTWRPLVTLTFWIDAHLGGGAPWLFHAENVLLHAAAAVLLVLAALRAGIGSRAALGAGMLFAALAAGSEAVCGIVGRADVMAAGFTFLAWWATGPLGGLALFAALLCKESALVAPLFLLVAGGRPKMGRVLALAAAVVGYLALRAWLFAGLDAASVRPDNNPLLGEPLLVRAATALHLFALVLRTVLAPLTLSADHSVADLLPDRAISVDVALGAAALVALAAAAWLARRRDRGIAIGIALLLVSFAPLSHLVRPLPALFAERLLYLPAAGVALALAAALVRSRVGLVVVGLLVAGNVARSVVRAGDWRDDATLWAAAVETTPRSAVAWTNHGVHLLETRRPEDAQAAFERAAAIRPAWAVPRSYLGVALGRRGALADAEAQLREGVRLDPELELAVVNLGAFLAGHGRADEARALLAPYVSAHPGAAAARRLLGALQSAP